MSIYAISDLHLSLSADKPMNIFRGWDNYVERIRANWIKIVGENDTVVLPGDLSWGLKLSETVKDFELLNNLPGKKIILKGNHDLWWPTLTKLQKFLDENGFKTIQMVHNNAIVVEEMAVCGTRGWFFDSAEQGSKVINREASRLETSITAAEATGKKPLVFLHYPPVYSSQVCNEILTVLKKHNIKTVYHGHIHGAGFYKSVTEYDGIKLKLISCDCIDFTPFFIV